MGLNEVFELAERVARDHVFPRAGQWGVVTRMRRPYDHTATLTVGPSERAVVSVGARTRASARRRIAAAIFGELIVRGCGAKHVCITMDGGPIDVGELP